MYSYSMRMVPKNRGKVNRRDGRAMSVCLIVTLPYVIF